MSYRKGTKVEWNWANGKGTGQIVRKFTKRVTLNIAGSEVTRNATSDNPAYHIEQCDGDTVLKSDSELQKAS